MEIITKTEGNKATMEISGWLDTQTAPQLGEALSGLEDSITSLVFDFTNLEYISSAGLRQVIVAYKKMAQKDSYSNRTFYSSYFYCSDGWCRCDADLFGIWWYCRCNLW